MEKNNNTMHANPFAGTGKVFSYSLKQMLTAKGWLISTLLMAALLLIGIPLTVLIVGKAAGRDEGKKNETAVRTVYVADETAGTADYSVLKEAGKYPDVNYIACGSMEEASAAAEKDSHAVVLRVTKPEDIYKLTVYLPEGTEVSRSKASSFGSFAAENFSALLMQKADLTPEETELLSMHVVTETAGISADADDKEDEKNDILTQIIMLIVPFLVVMTVYMMVILYGQSMANSVMLEKTSKLMETILTAVHPVALMTGKLLATACSAVIQTLIWMLAAAGGIIGALIAAVFSFSDMAGLADSAAFADAGSAEKISQLMESMGGSFPSISVSGIFITLIVVALGFLLYLSVATLSGAMASKQEDLNKTLVIFTMMLLMSMLLCLRFEVNEVSGELGLISEAKWLRFFPFTALLVLPADLIFGKLSAPEICLALLSMAAAVLLMIWLAAAVYKLLVLYRGNPPKIRQLITMLRGKKDEKAGS